MDYKSFIFYTWLLLVTIAVSVGADEPSIPAAVTGVEKDALKLPNAEQIAEVAEVAEALTQPLANAQEPQIEVVELAMNGDEMNEMLALHDEIEKEAAAQESSDKERAQPASADGNAAESNGAMLKDEDINKLMQMIAFPPIDNTKGSSTDIAAETAVKGTQSANDEVEPRASSARNGRALRSHGYYILALQPIGEPITVPTKYTKLDIIPAERALDGDLAVRRAQNKSKKQNLKNTDSDAEESRVISKKMFNRYIRRLMKKIRKGTRKIQRKTHHFKSLNSEPTVENFIRKMYAQRTVDNTKKKKSWFSWT